MMAALHFGKVGRSNFLSLNKGFFRQTTLSLSTDGPLIDDWLTHLRTSGYRLTEARRALVEIMATSQRPLSAQALFALAQDAHPDLGMATVYRTLEKLAELGLVQRVHDSHGCHTYVAASALPGPFMVICQGCGRLDALDDLLLQRLLQQIGQQSNYQVQHYWLQLSGLCAACQS